MIKKVVYTNEWTKFGRNSQLGLDYLHAHYVHYAYPRHSHEYYVLCLIERGRQSFLHRGSTYYTPPGGPILKFQAGRVLLYLVFGVPFAHDYESCGTEYNLRLAGVRIVLCYNSPGRIWNNDQALSS